MRTRLLCGILVAGLTLLAQCGLGPQVLTASGFAYDGSRHHDPDLGLSILAAAADDDETPAGSTNAPDPIQPALSCLSPLSLGRLLGQRERLFRLARHAPCAAPQTGPPHLHA